MHLVEARKPSLALVFASLVTLARAVPKLYFPVNSQVPPVAYVSQQYAFTFSATTFGSNESQLSYTIADGPEWLHLDTSNRSFTGTPAQSDLGANIVQLSASDSTGEVSDSITLIVLGSTQLGSGASILPQLQQAGSSSAPDSLLLRPLQPFEVTFAHDTFTGIGSMTIYYAISDNRSPLPPWVQFDSSQLSFSGTGPPLVSLSTPPQTYGFLLIASDVIGFAEATVPFDIVVGYNVFAFANVSQTVGISSGLPFQTAPLRTLLTLNGNVCADGQIASIVVDGPDWVELDKSRISLSGTPQTAANTLVTISVTDIYNDVANTTVFLQADSLHVVSLGTIGGVNVTLGKSFSYTLSNSTFTDSGSISASLGSAYGWLHFNSSNRVLSGQPPLSLPEDMIPVTIAFTNATTNHRAVTSPTSGKPDKQSTEQLTHLRKNFQMVVDPDDTSNSAFGAGSIDHYLSHTALGVTKTAQEVGEYRIGQLGLHAGEHHRS
ncbi:polarity establishment/cellular polarization [Elasticomyces elasticus]|uniref:Polarity establishment/cellular polarization n=1 Tax=Exophiala sideris TaxID=1016849 RepID=A0ABR0J4G7_9EURO|nr:polarity establishment/cellular polarization [Elasticomyces elasticus]KAK5027361.1 polarity establishment/cellular polarization [Exophiala sideris]KAK5034937.1 polarity establishment/cellular polarization [Exophiala sideris]KAK5056329.1 polarity establishment/cellular polarization [Exophiala sideris]KAK5181182.1 polarity establishment/cellular polarization [Eurotiomycetes sp. CCFEE 6388]